MIAACPIRLGSAFTALLLIGGSSMATAQTSVPSITITNGRTFLAGVIQTGADISAIETKSFTCTPVRCSKCDPGHELLKKGDKVAAMVSDDQLWAVDKLPLQVGTTQVAYPILAMVKSSGGFHGIFPAVLRTKIDIKAGETVRLDGYQVETRRAVKSGDTIPVLVIDDSLLSVEAADGAKDKNDKKPWFAAYKDNTKLSDRPALVEVWRVENEHVGR